MKLETLALSGSVSVVHDSSRGRHSSDGYVVEAKDAAGQLLAGVYVHDVELDRAVGPMVANVLRERVRCGTYVCVLSSLEIMALRGVVLRNIKAAYAGPEDAQIQLTHEASEAPSPVRPARLRSGLSRCG